MNKSRVMLLCCLLLSLLLSGCSDRIRTEFVKGAVVEKVELSDGLLCFRPMSMMIPYRPIGHIDPPEGVVERLPVTYDEICALTGVDYNAAISGLGQRFAVTAGDWSGERDFLQRDYRIKGHIQPEGSVWGGYQLYFHDEDYRSVSLTVNREGLFLNHPLMWTFWESDQFQEMNLYDGYPVNSQLGDVEIGLCWFSWEHTLTRDQGIVQQTEDYFFASFTVGGWRYALFSKGYCSQEEFVRLLLALVDACQASANAA